MGFENVMDSNISPTKLAAEGKTGVVLEGTYLGQKEQKFINKDTGKEESMILRKVQTRSGKERSIIQAGNLGYLFDKADDHPEVGQDVRIIYNGKQKAKKGPMAGKAMHNFNLEVDRGNDE